MGPMVHKAGSYLRDDNIPEQKNFIGSMNQIWDCHLEQGPGFDAPPSFYKQPNKKYKNLPSPSSQSLSDLTLPRLTGSFAQGESSLFLAVEL